MREIKFRVFFKKAFGYPEMVGKMCYEIDDTFCYWSKGQIKIYGAFEADIMQYTGLKDKNGKEIYESDYLDDWCVFWGSGKYILQNISTGDIIDCNEENTQNKEVTDNRYENPREHKAMETDL